MTFHGVSVQAQAVPWLLLKAMAALWQEHRQHQHLQKGRQQIVLLDLYL
jgi:hypothetical protein